ncbi:hypothetical protein GGR51DRAFT_499154 [Nemania sp. FL0031]|nr:hypothetical protein GGR51DRAFT_499154 [Nemania sp. FL0031]
MSATVSLDSLPRMKPEALAPSPASNNPVGSLSSARHPLSQNRSLVSRDSLQLTTGESQTKNSDTSEGENVDYAVVLDIPESLPLMGAMSRLTLRLSIDGVKRLHVNQTQYAAVSRTPIALSIGSKTVTGTRDPLLQLSIWVAAWHTHMHYLRSWKHVRDDEYNINTTSTDDTISNEIPPQAQPKLVSVILITIIGHEWCLYFACDQVASVTLYGPFRLGSTSSILGLYALVSSLRAIKGWIETEFYEQLRIWFQVKETESGD